MINWRLEFAIVKAALPVWEEFLFSDEIYWPLHFDHSLSIKTEEKTRLSAGRLSLAFFFLNAELDHNPDLRETIQPDLEALQQLMKRWPVNWEKKVEKEIPVRFRQLTTELHELRGKNKPYAAQFDRVIELRLLISCMIEQLVIDSQQKFKTDLTAIDVLIRSLTEPAHFIWQPEYASYFDSEIYWYLYRSLK